MSIPPVVRVFFAVELPPAIKEELGSYVGRIRKKSRGTPIRWSRPENLHITLQFLAEVRSEHLPALIKNVRAQVEGVMERATLTFGELHLFPNPYRPRVIVLEVNPQDDLAVLAGLIGEGIKATNYEIENRPFKAHLTIGRIKQPQGVDMGFLSEFKSSGLQSIEINDVVLYRSEPQPEGSMYTVLERIGLGGIKKVEAL